MLAVFSAYAGKLGFVVLVNCKNARSYAEAQRRMRDRLYSLRLAQLDYLGVAHGRIAANLVYHRHNIDLAEESVHLVNLKI